MNILVQTLQTFPVAKKNRILEYQDPDGFIKRDSQEKFSQQKKKYVGMLKKLENLTGERILQE